MFNYGGNNNFGERFDFFEWSAPYYETPHEVFETLNALQLGGRKLSAINVIGAYRRLGENNYFMYEKVRNAGIDLGDTLLKDYEHLNNIRVDWKAVACEPIQLVFDDGLTLEILPTEDGGARIATNSIPAGLVDGLNDSTFDSNIFFKEFIGKKIRYFEIKVVKKEEEYINEYSLKNGNSYTNIRHNYSIGFNFEDMFRLELEQSWESIYDIIAEGPSSRKYVPYSRVLECKKEVQQTEIVPGRDGGGTFWIIGYDQDEKEELPVPRLDCFGISIDQMDIDDYLYFFLQKYFDSQVQDEDEYYYGERTFDEYGGNLYTFDTMHLMLDDIRMVIEIIQNDFNNPYLEQIKDEWPIYMHTDKHRNELSQSEINDLLLIHRPIAIDFYERFCKRMEDMLKIPGRNMMSFAGP